MKIRNWVRRIELLGFNFVSVLQNFGKKFMGLTFLPLFGLRKLLGIKVRCVTSTLWKLTVYASIVLNIFLI